MKLRSRIRRRIAYSRTCGLWLVDQWNRDGGARELEAVAPWVMVLMVIVGVFLWMANGRPGL